MLTVELSVKKRGKSRGEARKRIGGALKLKPLGRGNEKAETEAQTKKAEEALHFAEEEYGEDSREVAVAMDACTVAYIRARKLQLAELTSQQSHILFEKHDGADSDTTVIGMMRIIHVFALEGKWKQVDMACEKAILMVTTAPVLTQAMKQLTDQIAVLVRIKCKLDKQSPGQRGRLDKLTGAR